MHNALELATRTLLQQFRRQRPLRGGSLIITLFGDAIAPRGGAITLASLIRLAEPFGLTERLVRTAVGRLAQEQWLVSRKNGRRSEYQLTGQGRRRFAEATQRIYGENPRSWSGHWTLLLMSPEMPRLERETLREQSAWLGFGQLGNGVLAHPNLSMAEARRQLKDAGLKASAVLLQAASEGAAADRQLVAKGWDLEELGHRYQRFARRFASLENALPEHDARLDPQRAFIIRTLLIHEYRKIHLRDPLLPAALLPADWIGAVAYELCRTLYRRVFAAAERYLGAHAETLSGKLRPASADTYRRFGGLQA